jgi:hypothetical protein
VVVRLAILVSLIVFSCEGCKIPLPPKTSQISLKSPSKPPEPLARSPKSVQEKLYPELPMPNMLVPQQTCATEPTNSKASAVQPAITIILAHGPSMGIQQLEKLKDLVGPLAMCCAVDQAMIAITKLPREAIRDKDPLSALLRGKMYQVTACQNPVGDEIEMKKYLEL